MTHQERAVSPAGNVLRRSRETGLKPTLAATKASAAALWFHGATPEVHGRWAAIHEPIPRWPRCTVPGLTDPEVASVELGAVQFLDRFGDRCRISELDEGESTRSISDAINREKNFRDLTHLSEQGL